MTVSEPHSIANLTPRAERIAQLNDRLRKTRIGGQIMMTSGVNALIEGYAAALLEALGEYDTFDEANDPHGERDFGDLHAFQTDLLWKIDYYDLNLEFASPDPANPDVTIRVLTVMLESEY